MPESLGGRPVTEDHLADRSGVVRAVERFGDRIERPVADPDVTGGIGQQVARPRGVKRRRGDQDRARLSAVIDEPDRHRAPEPALRATRLDPDEAPGGDQFVLHRATVGRGRAVGRQDGSGVSVGSGDSDGSTDPDGSADPDAPADAAGDGATDDATDGAAEVAGAEAAADADAPGELERVGPNVQPAPVVGLEQAATSATIPNATTAAAPARCERGVIQRLRCQDLPSVWVDGA